MLTIFTCASSNLWPPSPPRAEGEVEAREGSTLARGPELASTAVIRPCLKSGKPLMEGRAEHKGGEEVGHEIAGIGAFTADHESRLNLRVSLFFWKARQ